jgi:putative ABC transport system permease protein
MSPFQLAYLDLIRKKVPTLITVIAIAASVACAGVLLKLYILSVARFSTLVRGPDAVIGAKAGGIEILLGSLNLEGSYPEFIPGRLYQTLKQSQQIQFEAGSVFDPSVIKNVVPIVFFAKYKNHRVVATDERFFSQGGAQDAPKLLAGRRFEPYNEVVVGSSVAGEHGLHIGDSIAVHAWVSDYPQNSVHPVVSLRVVGILEAGRSAWNHACFASIAQADQVFQRAAGDSLSTWKNDVLHYLLVYLQPGGFRSVSELVNHRTVAEVVSVKEQRQNLEELTGTGVRLGLGITLLVVILAALSVAAVMITRFDAMKLQVAVLRALGFSRPELGVWLLWEGALLGVASCACGAVVEAVLFPVVRLLLSGALPTEEIVASHFYDSSPVWFASIIATMLALVVPLVQLSRQDVHSSLKGV